MRWPRFLPPPKVGPLWGVIFLLALLIGGLLLARGAKEFDARLGYRPPTVGAEQPTPRDAARAD